MLKLIKIVLFFCLGIFMYGCCTVMTYQAQTIMRSQSNPYESVVLLDTYLPKQSINLIATGFAVEKNKILTVSHFCVRANDINVIMFSGIEYVNSVKIKSFSVKEDLCLLEFTERELKPVYFVKRYSYETNIGDKVFSIGAPFGFFPTKTVGFVVNKNNNNRLIVSIPITNGNSGGPIFNEKNEVIGIVMAVLRPYHHITFCIGKDRIKKFLDNNL